MRPRAELVAGFGAFAVLAVVAAALGSRGRRQPDVDPRRSTYLTGPAGARGYAEALERLGVTVVRYRGRPAALGEVDTAGGPTVLAILGPVEPPDPLDAEAIVEFANTHDLLLAGEAAGAVMRCYGYGVQEHARPILTAVPGTPLASSDIRVRAVMGPARSPARQDSSPWDAAGRVAACAAPEPTRVDTLLRTAGGRAAALRLELAGGRAVTLVADDELFSNRALRGSQAGPFALRLVAGRDRRILFDEYSQGYGPSGSLLPALVSWSARSPWGWAGWQLSAVGLLALGAAAVRFGPIRPSPGRRRRSPLEHVRALATVLAAAHGHDLAVRLMVQGLRRRLSRGPMAARAAGLRSDPGPWVTRLAPHLRSSRARSAAASLAVLTGRPQGADGVLRAANDVEDVWEDLKP